MTDEPTESIPGDGVRRSSRSIEMPRLTPQEQDGTATAQQAAVDPGNPFLAPAGPVVPDEEVAPSRAPGFAPREEVPQAGPAAPPPMPVAPTAQAVPIGPPPIPLPPTAPAAPVTPPPPQLPPPPSMSSPYMPPPFEAAPEPQPSGRRRGAAIGLSAAAAVAVAFGAVSLTRGSSSSNSSADAHSGAGFPGATGSSAGPRDGGQPLDGSTSRGGGQDVAAGSASSASGSTAPGTGGQSSNAPGSQASNSDPSAPGTSNPPVIAPSASPTSAAKPTATAPAPTTPTTPPKTTTTTPKPPATSSKNMSCTGWHTTHVVSQDGSGYAATGTFAMRSGPYAACANVGNFTSGQHMYIWCHTINGYGNTWIYGRIDGTNSPAWQSLSNFKSGVTLGPVC